MIKGWAFVGIYRIDNWGPKKCQVPKLYLMDQPFLNLTSATWNILFLVIRYVLVALLLAYLTNVFVKRKDVVTDIKGSVLEWRVDTYKNIHRWVMDMKRVIAPPSQQENWFRSLLSSRRFKIGYQGMEYASFFDSPEKLIQFGVEFNRMLNKEEGFIDETLKRKLTSFQYWLDDAIDFLGIFIRVEYNERWHFDEETIRENSRLACQTMGIALQEDVNRFFNDIDGLLRDRLSDIKIAGVYSESMKTRSVKKATAYCECVIDKDDEGRWNKMVNWFYYQVLHREYGRSQLLKYHEDLLTLFPLVHFDKLFADNPSILENHDQLVGLIAEFGDCYAKYYNDEIRNNNS